MVWLNILKFKLLKNHFMSASADATEMMATMALPSIGANPSDSFEADIDIDDLSTTMK